MIKRNFFILLLVLCTLLITAFGAVVKAAESDTSWAKSSLAGSGSGIFSAIEKSSVDNSIYILGSVFSGTVDFGNSVTSTNAGNIVKYNSSGVAQWTKGILSSRYYGLGIDNVDNIYISGEIPVGLMDFGDGVTTTGVAAQNAFLVKYNSSGVAQWATSNSSLVSDISEFYDSYTDSLGNTYAVGYIRGTGTYDFGNSVTVSGANAGNNPIIVKYNSSGVAQWAVSTSVSPGQSVFRSVSATSDGSIYAVGYIGSTGTYDFGNSVTVAGANAGVNYLIVKYNSSGVAQWATSTSVGPGGSSVEKVSTDLSGNVYTAGYIRGTGTYDFGNSVTVSGGNASDNAVIVKYNSDGLAQWAKSTNSGVADSIFYALNTDSLGNSYVGGYIGGVSTYDFGNSIGLTSAGSYNPIIIKYNSDGLAQWAKSTTVSPNYASFYDFLIDGSTGGVYGVGEIDSSGTFNFGNGVTLTGANSEYNPFLIKYEIPLTSTSTPTSSSNPSNTISAASATECADSSPSGAPNLFLINMKYDSAQLFFSPVSNTDQYYVSFSTDSNAEKYGELIKLSSVGVQNHSVFFLIPNTKYYFKIRGVNGCAAGSWSNTLSTSNISSVINSPTSSPLPQSTSRPNTSAIASSSPKAVIDTRSIVPVALSLFQNISQVLGVYTQQIDIVVKTGVGLVGLISFASLLVASQTILSSLSFVYSTTARNVLYMPFDYINSLFQFVVTAASAKFSLIFPNLIKKKKGGLVFDALTFSPIKNAYVLIFSQSGNLKTSYTDNYGRYSFVDIPSGDYQLKTECNGYVYPSVVITSSQIQSMDHVYLPHEVIPVAGDTSKLDELSVPMDPTQKINSWKSFITTLTKLTLPICFTGIFIMIMALITNPSLFNQILMLLVGAYTIIYSAVHKKI